MCPYKFILVCTFIDMRWEGKIYCPKNIQPLPQYSPSLCKDVKEDYFLLGTKRRQ